MQPLSSGDPQMVGPYRVIAELGRGAMGRVLLGFGPDGRPAAVKLIHEGPAEDDEFRARFRREVDASRRVSGAYTAAVLDAGPDDPVPWLASEFLLGPTLREAVDAAGPLCEATALRLAAGLASALASIHRAAVVHRDLKPGNVILVSDGPRVIDFGIARATEGAGPELTRTGGVIGTPGFMSPEQAESEPITAASDVFSLGSVLVMACTGSSPFEAASTFRTLDNVVRAEPDLTGLPERVRRIAERCLLRDPAQRPSPAEVLALVGPVAPSSRPWPEPVSALADRRHRELSRLLDGGGEGTTLIDTGPTMVTVPEAPARTAGPDAAPPPVAPPQVQPSIAPSPSRVVGTIAALVGLAVIATIVWAVTRGDDRLDSGGEVDASGIEDDADAYEEDGWYEEDDWEEDAETEEGTPAQWHEVHSGLGLHFGLSTDEADVCEYQTVDFDDVDAEDRIYMEHLPEASTDSYTDLVWDPCSDTDMEGQIGYTNYLYTSANAYGTFYDAGVRPTAEDCWTAIDADRPELHWSIDTWSPDRSPLETGMTLCLGTDYEQVVLAEIVSVGPETDSTWMSVDFDVSVWTRY